MLDRIKRRLGTPKAKHGAPEGGKGQSLVEMAIITPLLLLLFIGVLEVGWAIRG
jgi:Flp pilus assembly protein TadG